MLLPFGNSFVQRFQLQEKYSFLKDQMREKQIPGN